jgi:hypothetical protein
MRPPSGFSVLSQTRIEEVRHEGRFGAHTRKQENRNIEPHGLQSISYLCPGGIWKVVLQKHTVYGLFAEQIHGLVAVACRHHFVANSF